MDYIQALRGIAALGVVLWHASRFVSPYGTGLGTKLFLPGSVLGVDLFFIISGFIMVRTTGSSDGTLVYGWNFFVKRFARIWPLYVFWTIVYVLLCCDLPTFLASSNNRLRLLQSFTFIPFSTGGPNYEFPALNVGWTLNYESYFYLIFGISLLFGRCRWVVFFGWITLSLLALPTILTGLPPTLAHTSYNLQPVYLNIICDPIIWLFVSGVLIGLIPNVTITLPAKVGTWPLLLVAIAGVGWQYCSGFRMAHGVTLMGLSLIPLFLLLTLNGGFAGAPIPRAFVVLGDISYSLYLVHPLVQEGLERFIKAIGGGAYASGFSFLILTTVASICLAVLSWHYLEQGLCNRIRDALLLSTSERGTRKPTLKRRVALSLGYLDQLRFRLIQPANLPFLILGMLGLTSVFARIFLLS